jgi:tetratricopeptide (TPR) repeat protein
LQPGFAKAHENLGDVLCAKGLIRESIAEYEAAAGIQSGGFEIHYKLGNLLLQTGRAGEAIVHFERALESRPDYVEAQTNLANVLATCPDASLRNGAKAIELAQQANKTTGGNNPIVLGTLAAAYAEMGRFPDAAATVQRALNLATAASNVKMANIFRTQLALYKNNTPLRDKSLTSGSARKP